MPDIPKESNLSVCWVNASTRAKTPCEDLTMPKPGETYWYRSLAGSVVIDRVYPGGGEVSVAKTGIPEDSYPNFDFTQFPHSKSVFDEGEIQIGCKADGTFHKYVHRPGNNRYFYEKRLALSHLSHLSHQASDGTQQNNTEKGASESTDTRKGS